MTPAEIRLHQKSAMLELCYEDASSYKLPAEYLRVFSPSAEVRGHSPEQAVLQHGKKDVNILNLEPQGNYAIKITFSDGHDSGIFSWQYLYELGRDQQANWADYLNRLQTAGKKREPQFIAVGR
ncbi:MAG: DUF971 domain-containing protein [Pseudomonadales bacterium]